MLKRCKPPFCVRVASFLVCEFLDEFFSDYAIFSSFVEQQLIVQLLS